MFLPVCGIKVEGSYLKWGRGMFLVDLQGVGKRPLDEFQMSDGSVEAIR